MAKVATAMPKDEHDWQAEEDVRAWVRAAAIAKDAKRKKAMIAAAKRMTKEDGVRWDRQAKENSMIKKMAGSKSTPTRM